MIYVWIDKMCSRMLISRFQAFNYFKWNIYFDMETTEFHYIKTVFTMNTLHIEAY